MRLKLILSFVFIVLITIATTLFVSFQQTAKEVSSFVGGGGLSGTQHIVSALERHYKMNSTWAGAEDILFSTTPRMQPMGQGNGIGPFRGENSVSNVPTPERLQLLDTNGIVIYDTARESMGESVTTDVLNRAIGLESNGETVGYLLPSSGVPALREIASTLTQRIRDLVFTTGMIVTGISLVLALGLANQLIRPVKQLTQAANNLARGDLSYRVPVKGSDELATLGKTFNVMAQSLQDAEVQRKALTADIAHELRTPLAVQRAHLEAMIDGIYPMDAEHILPIVDQNHLLSRLVEDLRTIALADAGQLHLEKTRTNLGALLSRVVERFNAQAVQDHIELGLNIIDPCTQINVDPQRIEQILNNLLSNALRYSPPNGVVRIDLSCSGDQAAVTVHDGGPGIPEEALPHLFERFYKADHSRARSGGGTGLGLSIARKLAQSHHGDLVAANHPNGGALFTLTLPITES